MITDIFPPVIWYEYKGEEICWNGKQYLSVSCCGSFDTLEDLDKFWEGYWAEERKIGQ